VLERLDHVAGVIVNENYRYTVLPDTFFRHYLTSALQAEERTRSSAMELISGTTPSLESNPIQPEFFRNGSFNNNLTFVHSRNSVNRRNHYDQAKLESS
jgi:hypothetical protein